jgi:hypothetical protein
MQTTDDESGEVGGMGIGKRNRSTRRKRASVPLCPPQIPHNMSRAGTRAAAVGGKAATNRLSYGTAQLSITLLVHSLSIIRR